MKNIIGIDAAKLAGLEIDLLQKMRKGHITAAHLQWFSALTKGERDALVVVGKPALKAVSPVEPIAKFALLAELGIFTVPEDYVHGGRLDSFKLKYQNDEVKSFYYYNEDITDANFPNPSRILKPGDKLRVRAYKQIVPGTTTSKERMDFLATQNTTVYPGAQGASLVWEQMRAKMPKGFWYAAFDEEEHLWKDTHGHRRVPSVFCGSAGDFCFSLGSFELVWYGYDAFFGFCDESLGA